MHCLIHTPTYKMKIIKSKKNQRASQNKKVIKINKYQTNKQTNRKVNIKMENNTITLNKKCDRKQPTLCRPRFGDTDAAKKIF